MEVLFVKPFLCSTRTIFSKKSHSTNSSTQDEFLGTPLFSRRVRKKTGCSRVSPMSKRSIFQDFQGFANPSRLLQAAEANTYIKYISDDVFPSMELGKANSFYVMELQTSKDYGSCFRDLNAALLVCLIDVNGDSILQRISAVTMEYSENRKEMTESIHFQRGSVDIITFKGPKLDKIEALWIGLESGSWRLDGICLTVMNEAPSLSSSIEGMEEQQFDALQYKFEANNILLGEGGMSVAEVRPVLVTEFPEADFSFLLKNMYPSSALLMDHEELSNEEGMKEYSDLKFSLLLYDGILVSTGSTILLTFSSTDRDAYSFLVGGIAGFLYLLLLQKSVDGLSVDIEKENRGFGRFKGPLFSLALIFATSIITVKYGLGVSSFTLTPTELFLGVAGFLTCKISVVLAAFKPIISSSNNKV